MSYFADGAPRSCFTCHWYAAFQPAGRVVECANPACARIRSQPEHGCAAWQREPGADDEGDDPARWRRMMAQAAPRA